MHLPAHVRALCALGVHTYPDRPRMMCLRLQGGDSRRPGGGPTAAGCAAAATQPLMTNYLAPGASFKPRAVQQSLHRYFTMG